MAFLIRIAIPMGNSVTLGFVSVWYKDSYNAFFGIHEIFMKIHQELPNDYDMMHNYIISKSSLKILKNNADSHPCLVSCLVAPSGTLTADSACPYLHSVSCLSVQDSF